MLAAAAAWDGLAAELAAAAESFGSVTAGLAGGPWQGPASSAMAAAAAPYAGWLSSTGMQAAEAGTQARVLASAFEATMAAIVHPAAIAANRSELVSLVLSNIFGFNAPAIAATEASYEAMWAQDVAAMIGYHVEASTAAAALKPFTQLLQNPSALLSQVIDASLSNSVAGGVAAAATETKTLAINLGLGNLGSLNIGNGNVGSLNIGSGNFGSFNILGFGNLGDSNFGFGNVGNNNFGFGNVGNNNFGFGNIGAGLTPGNFNIGWGNTGNNNIGIGNTGDNNFGFGNTGNGNQGFGLTGDNNFGFGSLNSGTGNVGLFNSGTGNWGIGNSGTNNTGIGN
ncbi:PPE domain-containing protein, partial [Mycobacterium intermedium]